MSLRSLVWIGLTLFVPAERVRAQQPEVGGPAPAIVAAEWLNWQGAAPTLESLKGRAVMIEFWGTWCAPCVRAMPGVQKLHDRYRERGLTVLAISYETPAVMQPFLTEHAYTMPVGSDPEKKTVGAYGIRSWPTSVVIDKEGRVDYVGPPFGAEAAVERVLGLEAGPAAVLDAWLESLKNPAKNAQRDALQRLVEKASSEFDLQTWARGHGAPETVEGAGAPPPAAVPAKAPAKLGDPVDALRRCAKAWSSDAALRAQLLLQLADSGPTVFDLAAFAQDTFAKEFPFDANELKVLLGDKKYADVVEAIAQRAPAAPVLAAAAKSKELSAWCKGKSSEERASARKGLMSQRWLFAGVVFKDEAMNTAFFNELSANGMAMSQDKKAVTGVTIGGEMVMQEKVESFIQSHMTQALIMEDLAESKSPKLKELPKLVEQARAMVLRDLEGRYGKPEPRAAK